MNTLSMTILVIMLLIFSAILLRRGKVVSEQKARSRRMQAKRKRKAALPPLPVVSQTEGSLVTKPQKQSGKRSMILVVDDSKAALMNAKKILDQEMYRVVMAENGREAWGVLQEEKPDLILSDIDMPALDGFGLLKLVREDLRLSDIPFILMTSNMAAHAKAYEQKGFDSLLPKPYKPEDLIEQIKFLLQE